jgi:hypothetical protein
MIRPRPTTLPQVNSHRLPRFAFVLAEEWTELLVNVLAKQMR